MDQISGKMKENGQDNKENYVTLAPTLPRLFPASPFCLSQPLQVYFLRGLQFLLLAWVPSRMLFLLKFLL